MTIAPALQYKTSRKHSFLKSYSVPKQSRIKKYFRRIIVSAIVFGVILVATFQMMQPEAIKGRLIPGLEEMEDSNAVGINNKGQVVGTFVNRDGYDRAFLWTETEGIREIGTLGGASSSAYAIDDESKVYGWSEKSAEISHGTITQISTHFVWTEADGLKECASNRSGKTIHIPMRQSVPPIAAMSGNGYFFTKVNDKAQVIGYFLKEGGMNRRAFLWTNETGILYLDTLGLAASDARDINEKGQIVGFVRTAPPWWARTWNWACEKFKLPSGWQADLQQYRKRKAVLWTVPSELMEKVEFNQTSKNP
ncbi:MAG: hypothetical protein LBV12_02420 [Puniceicoccales bacterium]|jgi:probable HAF family extracellular repeat protein|nr:hypothetical protein [Puniceicoccales bacterium]